MNPDQKLISSFEAELKYRVNLKTSPSSAPEKVLLDSFKYFDLEKTGEVDFRVFSMVFKMRLGIILFSEEELLLIFNYFTSGATRLVYREFISSIYDTQINLSLKDSRLSEARSFLHSQPDASGEEEAVRRLIEYIVYKMRALDFWAFFRLNKELQAGKATEREVAQGQLVVALKKTGVEISAEEVQRVFGFLSGGRPLLPIEQLFDCLLVNFSEARKSLARAVFDKVDYAASGKISLQLLKELFNPRNSFAVREGRQVSEELARQFGCLVDEFSRLNGNQFIVGANQFLQFFAFISGHFKDDKEFANFAENCFRFNELPRSSGSVKNERLFKAEGKLMEELSIRTSQPEDFYAALFAQLAAKGNRAFIVFFKLLKCNDFDSDGFVFEKEFERVVGEMRLGFSKAQIQRLFEKTAEQKMRLGYVSLLKNMLPAFDQEKAEVIQRLYDKLAGPKALEPPTFDKLVTAFNARNHPDFKNGLRPDYEIRAEFVEMLKEFLPLFQGNSAVVLLPSLLRFFEFFAATWSTAYLRSVVELSFKMRGTGAPGYSLEQTTPYGTGSNNEPVRSEIQRPGLPAQLKFREEFAKATGRPLQEAQGLGQGPIVGQTEPLGEQPGVFKKRAEAPSINYPYYTEAEGQTGGPTQNPKHANYKTKTPFYIEEANPGQIPAPAQNINVKLKEANELAKTPDSRTSRNSRKAGSRGSEFNPLTREPLAPGQRNGPNSPEEGSVVSDARSKQVINELNSKIQSSLSQKPSVPPQTASLLLQRLAENVRQLARVEAVLSIESEMTAQSDKKGNVDFEVFCTALENNETLKGFRQEETHALFVANIAEAEKVHIQTFANKLRGQMSQFREKQTIELFDRICPPNEDAMLPSELKAAFLPHKCKLRGYKGMAEVKEMMGKLVDLFMSLNVVIKNQDFIDLDDFLYFMDNFSFYLVTEEEYTKFLAEGFK